MRLSDRIHRAIKETALQSFGEVDVILFGSRTDDDRKGGDIDLAIDSHLSSEQFRHAKALFLSYLLRKGLELEIDLVQIADCRCRYVTAVRNIQSRYCVVSLYNQQAGCTATYSFDKKLVGHEWVVRPADQG